MSALGEALPQSFDFYSIAWIEKSKQTALTSEKTKLIALSIQGDQTGALIAHFDSATDSEMAREILNTIASKFATRLNSEQGLDLMISPPSLIEKSTLGRFRKNYEKIDTLFYDMKEASGNSKLMSIEIYWET